MDSASEKFVLKDYLFNNESVNYLASLLKHSYPSLEKEAFMEEILSEFPDLELKERISCIRQKIEKYIQKEYRDCVNILLSSLKENTQGEHFIFAAYAEYVAVNGCADTHFEYSLNALGEITKHFSAEFAIRDFINKYPDETYNKMLEWSKSTNVHQRRLASEGLRPLLPWGRAINYDYKTATNVLDNLYFDKERYVTRSVANHLNDISKKDAEFVLNKLEEWKKSGKQDKKEMDYIIQHSLRTLIKKGHQNTLRFLGYRTNPKIKVSDLAFDKNNIKMGDKLQFSFEITAEADEKLIVDYKVIYPTQKKASSEKVFKLKNIELKAGEKKEFEKGYVFKNLTTKKLYPGEHSIEVQINGKMYASKSFHLVN